MFFCTKTRQVYLSAVNFKPFAFSAYVCNFCEFNPKLLCHLISSFRTSEEHSVFLFPRYVGSNWRQSRDSTFFEIKAIDRLLNS